MKNSYLTFILSLFLLSPAFSQNTSNERQASATVFSIGVGFGTNGDWGVFVSNDLKIQLNKYLALNPRLGYFETVAPGEVLSFPEYNSHSGIFTDLGLSFSFIRERDYAFSLNAGPSFQLGNETRTTGQSTAGGELIDETFEHSRIRRFGFYTDLEYSWNREGKYLHTVVLKTYSFDIYPEFLGLGYKIGFKL